MSEPDEKESSEVDAETETVKERPWTADFLIETKFHCDSCEETGRELCPDCAKQWLKGQIAKVTACGFSTTDIVNMLLSYDAENQLSQVLMEGIAEYQEGFDQVEMLADVGGESALDKVKPKFKDFIKKFNEKTYQGYREPMIKKPGRQSYLHNCRMEHYYINLFRAKKKLARLLLDFTRETGAVKMLIELPEMNTLAQNILIHRNGDPQSDFKSLSAYISYEKLSDLVSALYLIQHSPDFHRSDIFVVSLTDNLSHADVVVKRGEKDKVKWVGRVSILLCVEGMLCTLDLLPAMIYEQDDLNRKAKRQWRMLSDILLTAARVDDVPLCQRVLEARANPNACSESTLLSGLHYAGGNGNVEIIQLLLNFNAVPSSSAMGERPFMCAVYNKHLSAAVRLLEKEKKEYELSQTEIDMFWSSSDLILENLARCPEFNEDAEKWDQMLAHFESLGYGINQQRNKSAVNTEVQPVINTLAKYGAIDSHGRTVLMYAAADSKMAVDTNQTIMKNILESLDKELLNLKDQDNKTAVDFAINSSNYGAALLLLEADAVDGFGIDVFRRAVLEDDVVLVQFLLMALPSNQRESIRNESAWACKDQMWMMQSKDNTRATFCTCFVPVDQKKLFVRYPLVFDRMFPRLAQLMRANNLLQILEEFRSKNHLLKPDNYDRPELTGYDGYDVFQGAITCWVCKQPHEEIKVYKGPQPHVSWIGPVFMDQAKTPELSYPLRLFFHHDCGEKLDRELQSGFAGFVAEPEKNLVKHRSAQSRDWSRLMGHSPMPLPESYIPMKSLSPRQKRREIENNPKMRQCKSAVELHKVKARPEEYGNTASMLINRKIKVTKKTSSETRTASPSARPSPKGGASPKAGDDALPGIKMGRGGAPQSITLIPGSTAKMVLTSKFERTLKFNRTIR